MGTVIFLLILMWFLHIGDELGRYQKVGNRVKDTKTGKYIVT